eukprot:Colp12_sorted_trinity150504_noHs@21811
MGGGASKLNGRPVVVVVGGGYAGTAVAKALDPYFNVVLIDRKNYFLHVIGALRSLANASWTNNVLIPYDALLKNGYVLQGEVTKIESDAVHVANLPDPIKFDYLVIATGSSYAFPVKVAQPNRENAFKFYEEAAEEVTKASKIVIIGAGPVGVELAGEIKERYPEKDVTIVGASEKLIPGPFNDTFRAKLSSDLETLGIKVVLGEKALVEGQDAGGFGYLRYKSGAHTVATTKEEKQIQSELTFFCVGAHLNNASLQQGMPEKLDEKGQIKVNEFLQVEGLEKVFALGDIANAGAKLAFLADLQAKVVVNNIRKHDAGKPLSQWKAPQHAAILVPIGTKSGATQLPTASGKVLGSFVTRLLKGKGLFAEKTWKTMNKKFPNGGDVAMAASDSQADEGWKTLATAMSLGDEAAEKLIKGLPVEVAEGSTHT